VLDILILNRMFHTINRHDKNLLNLLIHAIDDIVRIQIVSINNPPYFLDMTYMRNAFG